MHEIQMKALTFHCSKVLTRCSFSNRYLRPGLLFLAGFIIGLSGVILTIQNWNETLWGCENWLQTVREQV